MKEENRMMQDEMMNEEEIIGKEIEKELEWCGIKKVDSLFSRIS